LKTIALILFAAAIVTVTPTLKAQTAADTEALQTLQKRYVETIRTADAESASKIFSHSPETIFIDPLGTERGLKEIQDVFIGKTMGKMFTKRELILENPAIHVYGEAAWSEMTWTFHATLRGNGQEITTKGRETQIYHKENGEWHIVAVHYSSPAITAEPKGF
jgi:hypothetical protein